jgi:hypothetical protein
MPMQNRPAKLTDKEQVSQWMSKLKPEMIPAVVAVRKIIM